MGQFQNYYHQCMQFAVHQRRCLQAWHMNARLIRWEHKIWTCDVYRSPVPSRIHKTEKSKRWVVNNCNLWSVTFNNLIQISVKLCLSRVLCYENKNKQITTQKHFLHGFAIIPYIQEINPLAALIVKLLCSCWFVVLHEVICTCILNWENTQNSWATHTNLHVFVLSVPSNLQSAFLIRKEHVMNIVNIINRF